MFVFGIVLKFKFQFILIHMFFLDSYFSVRAQRSIAQPGFYTKFTTPTSGDHARFVEIWPTSDHRFFLVVFCPSQLPHTTWTTCSRVLVQCIAVAQGPKYGEIMIRNTRAKQTVIVNDMKCCKTNQPSNQVCN